jgi:UDP-3-O-[3-hydroxymyristoyl] N-acetylglucosamine deacetylase
MIPAPRCCRNTVGRSASLAGRAILTGALVQVTLRPSECGSGLCFRHLPTGVVIPADLDHAANVPNCTSLAGDGARIDFVEHLMAALFAGGITDAVVEVDGGEVPLLDGSAAPYHALIEEAGVVSLGEFLEPFALDRVVTVGDGVRTIEAAPSAVPGFEYLLDHPHPLIGRQAARFHTGAGGFAVSAAPARTFATEEEAKALVAARGLAGAELGMAIIAYDDRLSDPEPFPQSFAMHKIVDLMGDLYLLGRPVAAHVRGSRTGHADNRALAAAIRAAAHVAT